MHKIYDLLKSFAWNNNVCNFYSKGAPPQNFSTFEYPNELQPVPNDYNKAGHSADAGMVICVDVIWVSSTRPPNFCWLH